MQGMKCDPRVLEIACSILELEILIEMLVIALLVSNWEWVRAFISGSSDLRPNPKSSAWWSRSTSTMKWNNSDALAISLNFLYPLWSVTNLFPRMVQTVKRDLLYYLNSWIHISETHPKVMTNTSYKNNI